MSSEQLKYFLAGDGVSLGYRILRQAAPAPTLIMLHGLASNHTRWSEFVGHTELSRDWNLVRPDLRGHSHSMTRRHFRREDWVADLAGLVEHEQLGPVVIAGHSLGAQVAQLFALRFPGLTRALILIDPVYPELLHGVLGQARRIRWLLALLVRFLRLFNSLRLRKKQYPIRDLYALDVQTRELLKQTSAEEIARLYMNPRIDLEFMPLANYVQDIVEVVRPLPDMAGLTLPVQVLLSTGTSISDAAALEAMIRRMPNSAIQPIHCNHWPLTEQPVEVRAAIEAACRKWQADT